MSGDEVPYLPLNERIKNGENSIMSPRNVSAYALSHNNGTLAPLFAI